MRTLFAAVALMAVPLSSHAELPQATVEYSADSVMEAEGMTMRTRIYHALEKERREVSMSGQKQIMILRMDKGVSWMLMPDSNQYMEMPIEVGLESSGDLAGYDLQRSPAGKEKVGGLETTKYKVAMSSPEGFKFEGFMWATEQGIVVKMDAAAEGVGDGGRMHMELSNIHVGKQESKLFEIPAGYSKFDMGSFGRTSAQ